MKNPKILLIGDSCNDVFIYGETTRLNPEAPTPIFKPKNKIINGGMVLNVLNNIKALGYDADLITQKEKMVKKRFVDQTSNYILLRVDDEQPIKPLSDDVINNIPDYDLVVVSDYNKGFLTESTLSKILLLSKISFIDTKKSFDSWIEDATYIKINEKEYNNPNHIVTFDTKTIVTLGGNGCRLNGLQKPSEKVSVRDVVGAGDTFLAAVSTKYLETKDIYKSMEFANKCASQVVSKRGVAVPDINKIKP